MAPRGHPRYRVRIRVDCSTRDMFVSNHVTNLCRGGIFIEGETTLPLESEVHLTLILPLSRRRIECTGRVVWTYDMKRGTTHVVPGMGIKFLDMADEHRAALEQYLEMLARLNPLPIEAHRRSERERRA